MECTKRAMKCHNYTYVIGLSTPLSKVIPTLVYIRASCHVSYGSCTTKFFQGSMTLCSFANLLKKTHQNTQQPLTPLHCQHPPMIMMQSFHSLTHWTSLWTFPSPLPYGHWEHIWNNIWHGNKFGKSMIGTWI